MKITLVTVGKIKERYFEDAIRELSLIHISEPTRH